MPIEIPYLVPTPNPVQTRFSANSSTTPLLSQLTGSGEHNKEVHAVDTDGGIVLDAQIDVFLDAKPEVAGAAEVAATQLVLAYL